MQIQPDEDLISSFLEKKFRYSKSFATQKTYCFALNRFTEFIQTKYNLNMTQILEQFRQKNKDPIEVLDEFYTYLSSCKTRFQRGYTNGTMRLLLSTTKEFFNSQGLHVYNEDVKQRFRMPRRESVYEEGLSKEILVRLLHNASPRLQTAILMCVSGGMRISELVQLRLSDIDFTTNPTSIRLRKETTKTRETRFTCISKEATNSLKDYLRKKHGWSEEFKEDRYIFLQTLDERIAKLQHTIATDEKQRNYARARMRVLEKAGMGLSLEEKHDKAVSSARITLEESLSKVIDRIPELSKKNENGRQSIHFHAFRAWFKTQVTDAHQSDFAEALMGHKSIKLGYYRQNNEARFKTYLEIEHALTISDHTQIEKTLQSLTEKYKELERKYEEFRKYAQNNSISIPSSH